MMIKNLRYKALLRQHKNRIYNYARFMLKDGMDADDVTQEVFIRIWNNLDSFNPAAAKTWIMKTTHNLCLDYLRKRKISYQREFSIDENFAENFEGDKIVNDPEIKTRQAILKRKIKESVETLPDNLKSIFVMYEFQGLRYREISEILDLPMNTVKVYLLRARKKLQEELKEFRHEQYA